MKEGRKEAFYERVCLSVCRFYTLVDSQRMWLWFWDKCKVCVCVTVEQAAAQFCCVILF